VERFRLSGRINAAYRALSARNIAIEFYARLPIHEHLAVVLVNEHQTQHVAFIAIELPSASL